MGRRRGRVARLVREARFPDLKTLDQTQWDDLQGVDRKQVAELASCDYLEQGEDVVIAGQEPPGHSPGPGGGTAAVLGSLLEGGAVREESEALVQQSANRARLALKSLPLSADSLKAFEDLDDFVAFLAS